MKLFLSCCVYLQPITVEYRNKCEYTIGVDPDGNGEIQFVFFLLECYSKLTDNRTSFPCLFGLPFSPCSLLALPYGRITVVKAVLTTDLHTVVVGYLCINSAIMCVTRYSLCSFAVKGFFFCLSSSAFCREKLLQRNCNLYYHMRGIQKVCRLI